MSSNRSLVDGLRRRGRIKSSEVYDVLLKVDRADYCRSGSCYQDRPMSIHHGQTISAPHMHAKCLELFMPIFRAARLESRSIRVLDVGAGSGIMIACFSHLLFDNESEEAEELGEDEQSRASGVFGIEYLEPLVRYGRENIRKDGFIRSLIRRGVVSIAHGDGWQGLPDQGPFDFIHVGAAAARIPPKLVEQLRVGGAMVIPVGEQGHVQHLMKVDKVLSDGRVRVRKKRLSSVRYVPLVEPDRRFRS